MIKLDAKIVEPLLFVVTSLTCMLIIALYVLGNIQYALFFNRRIEISNFIHVIQSHDFVLKLASNALKQ